MDYLKALLGASALVSIATAFAPMREGVRRAVLSAFAVVFLLLLIPKDLALDFSFPQALPEASTDAAVYYTDAWQEGLERGLLLDLCDKFSLDRDAISLQSEVTVHENTVEISYLSVTLHGENAFADATGMVRYIEKAYGCRSEIHLAANG